MDGINGRATIDFRNVGDLVAIEVGGAPGAVVAQSLIESARDERNLDEAERGALEKQLQHTEQEQVDAMHDEADATRAAGLAKGLAMIGSGALGAASAVAGYQNTRSGDLYKGALDGAAKVAEGTGSLLEASFGAEGKDRAADGTAAGNAAQQLQRRLKEIGERIDESRAQSQKAIDSAAQAVESQARVEQATLFIRG